MCADILSIAFNCLLSILTGIYGGLVVSRFLKFEDVRGRVRVLVNRVEYTNDAVGEGYVVTSSTYQGELTECSTEFFYMGHERAGDSVNNLRDAIRDASCAPRHITGDIFEFNHVWNNMVRSMRPNFFVLFSLKLKI